ncbi:MAG: bifunctional folylpolyglutamate synthase/dihydrofolate synthase [Gemmatimonadota bacterium]
MRGLGGAAERIQPGLERILLALDISGHPERSFRTIHVAGTNGKGSTACFAEAILRRLLGAPVGLYTSPHLVSPVERIRVSGAAIPDAALRRALARASVLSRAVACAAGAPLSWFEEMTWAACDWFRRRGVALAVMETGLGGRWDATTACPAEVAVITNVGVDHTEWLGRSIRAIASEKAGILRDAVPAVFGRMRTAARRVAGKAAAQAGCPVWEWGRDFRWEDAGRGRFDLRIPGMSLPRVRIGMAGAFQRDNAAVACAAAWLSARRRGFGAPEFASAAREALAEARWPGRLCRLPGPGNARAWVDGAHNPDAGTVLGRALAEMKAGGRIGRVVALWSMLGDKDVRGFLGALRGDVDLWVAYEMGHERAAPLRRLVAACRREGVPVRTAGSFDAAWRTAREEAGKRGIVIVCGSLVAVGDAYRHRVGANP